MNRHHAADAFVKRDALEHVELEVGLGLVAAELGGHLQLEQVRRRAAPPPSCRGAGGAPPRARMSAASTGAMASIRSNSSATEIPRRA